MLRDRNGREIDIGPYKCTTPDDNCYYGIYREEESFYALTPDGKTLLLTNNSNIDMNTLSSSLLEPAPELIEHCNPFEATSWEDFQQVITQSLQRKPSENN